MRSSILRLCFAALTLLVFSFGASVRLVAQDDLQDFPPEYPREFPQPLPQRDVDITYDVKLQKQHLVQRVRWLAGEGLERIDSPDRSVTIVNHTAGEVTLLTPRDGTFRKLEARPRPPLEPASGMKPVRGHDATIAGQRCVEWSWTEDVETHTVCSTGDGVLLRLVVGGVETRLARSVTYAAQSPELFQVPRNYTPALAPEGGGQP